MVIMAHHQQIKAHHQQKAHHQKAHHLQKMVIMAHLKAATTSFSKKELNKDTMKRKMVTTNQNPMKMVTTMDISKLDITPNSM